VLLKPEQLIGPVLPPPPPPPPPLATLTVVVTAFAEPLALLGTTEKVVVDVIFAEAEPNPVATAGAAHVKFVGGDAVPQVAVNITGPPAAGRLFRSAVSEQPEGAPPGGGVVGAPSQFSVKLPLPPVTENDAQDELLNVNDAAWLGAAPKVSKVLQQISAAVRAVRIINGAPRRRRVAGRRTAPMATGL